MQNTGIIILAAGNSSRLGEPKQLLPFRGTSLLNFVVGQAQDANPAAVFVVLGAYERKIRSELDSRLRIVTNPEWESGMASSLRVGVEALLQEFPDVDNCIVAVCDQPSIEGSLFRRLIREREISGKGIVSSFYSGIAGVPVLFSSAYFQELMLLNGTEGARSLVKKYAGDLAFVPFDGGEVDIDTMEDFQRLTRQMISVVEAKQIIAAKAQFQPVKSLSIAEATGFILAEDVVAKIAVPSFVQSSMDGYAIRFEDRLDPLKVIGEMVAGAREQLTIHGGQATRIFTGAPLPEGADTVIIQERAFEEKGKLICNDSALSQGQNVRAIGAEISDGQLAMSAGSYLSAAAVGYLSGIGVSQVPVFAAPSVGILLTGNELQQPGQPLAFGQVYEANSAQIRGALRKAGVDEIRVYHSVDDPEELTRKLNEALFANDMVLLIGGVSVGDYDFVTKATEACGIRQQFHKIKQKPGKPLYFGAKGDQLVFGLPGNPASSLTCFYEYVFPAIRKSMGFPDGLTEVFAVATHGYRKPRGLTHFLKAHYEKGCVTPLHAQESFRLQSFAQANCFIVLAEDSEGIEVGEEVNVHLLPL